MKLKQMLYMLMVQNTSMLLKVSLLATKVHSTSQEPAKSLTTKKMLPLLATMQSFLMQVKAVTTLAKVTRLNFSQRTTKLLSIASETISLAQKHRQLSQLSKQQLVITLKKISQIELSHSNSTAKTTSEKLNL